MGQNKVIWLVTEVQWNVSILWSFGASDHCLHHLPLIWSHLKHKPGYQGVGQGSELETLTGDQLQPSYSEPTRLKHRELTVFLGEIFECDTHPAQLVKLSSHRHKLSTIKANHLKRDETVTLWLGYGPESLLAQINSSLLPVSVRPGSCSTSSVALWSGVPQGPIMGPILQLHFW